MLFILTCPQTVTSLPTNGVQILKPSGLALSSLELPWTADLCVVSISLPTFLSGPHASTFNILIFDKFAATPGEASISIKDRYLPVTAVSTRISLLENTNASFALPAQTIFQHPIPPTQFVNPAVIGREDVTEPTYVQITKFPRNGGLFGRRRDGSTFLISSNSTPINFLVPCPYNI
jgi:hypothetical protein